MATSKLVNYTPSNYPQLDGGQSTYFTKEFGNIQKAITSIESEMAFSDLKGSLAFSALTGTVSPTQLGITSLTNAIGSDVVAVLALTAYDGPSVAQGTSGTWLVTGTVTLLTTSGTGDKARVGLTDGTSLFSDIAVNLQTNLYTTVSLSAVVTTPAGNLKFTFGSTPGGSVTKMIHQAWPGGGHSSTITAVRIG